MEYLVLARKWRPQAFDDVLGQEHVVRTLSNAITQERIAHAFLFSGPRGVGKTSIARILAKALNCEQGPTPTPCNKCVHCTEITDGIAIDVREIDGASNRGIDEIRELRENVKFAPASCRYKVYIIDEVHMLTREAFNALLKTLEEPPGHVIFIFATTETHKVPATILSRCQTFEFRRIPLRLIADSLKKIAAAEGITVSDRGLAWIAEAGDGSLRDSQSIFDQVISYAGFTIEDAAVEELLGRSDRRFLFSLSDAVLARDAGRCLKIIDEAYYAGLDMKFFGQTLLGHFRNLLLVGIAGREDSLVELPADEREKYRVQTEGASRETLQRYLEILMAEEENLRRSQNPRLNLEAILCRLAWLEPLIPIDEVLGRMESLERRLAAGAAPPGGPGGSAPPPPGRGGGAAGGAPTDPKTKESAAPPATAGSRAAWGGNSPSAASSGRVAEQPGEYGTEGDAPPQGGWEGFKAFLKRHDPILCSKVEMGKCLACGDGVLRIGFEKVSSQKDHIFLSDVREKERELADLGRRFFRREVELTIETLPFDPAGAVNGTGGQNGNGNGRAAKNQRFQEVRREALSHPLVLKVLDLFPRAEVRDVRLREVSAAAEPAPAPPVFVPDGEDPLLAAPSEPSDEAADQD
ncbi:MAG: DNA polymerase III subunit gamma/tau [Syntrophales bacterium]